HAVSQHAERSLTATRPATPNGGVVPQRPTNKGGVAAEILCGRKTRTQATGWGNSFMEFGQEHNGGVARDFGGPKSRKRSLAYLTWPSRRLVLAGIDIAISY